MPRTVNFLDGQQSPTAPLLGSLNRTVTGSEAGPLEITASGGIPTVDKPVEMIFLRGDDGGGSPANINITANPQITAGTLAGQELNLYGTSDSAVVTLDDGNGLLLNGSIDLDSRTGVTLLWTGTLWRQDNLL